MNSDDFNVLEAAKPCPCLVGFVSDVFGVNQRKTEHAKKRQVQYTCLIALLGWFFRLIVLISHETP